MSFSINCLEITATKEQWMQSKDLYKNLLSEEDYESFEKNKKIKKFRKRFFFNDFYVHKQHGTMLRNKSKNQFDSDVFFGKNINIQAIVGKNGSGKSSLMDLMYMAINNLSFMFERGKDRPGAEPLCFIPNLRVNLYFSLNKRICELICNDNSVYLVDNGKKYPFNKNDGRKKINDFNSQKLGNLVRSFFYSIVSNYSMQSFISSNYKTEVYNYESTSNPRYIKRQKSWINSIFHKNDGYIRSIVLNPFRSYGKINLENELELSKDRLTSLLVWYKQQEVLGKQKNGPFKSPFDPYQFYRIKFQYKLNFVFEKYENYFQTELERSCLKECAKNDEGLSKFILENCRNRLLVELKDRFFLPPVSKESNFSTKIAYAYLIIKILSIIKKYPNYLRFSECCQLKFLKEEKKNISKMVLDIPNENILVALLETLKRDSSHITKKIWRTMHFLRIASNNEWIEGEHLGREYLEALTKWYCGKNSPYNCIFLSHQNDNWLRYLSPFSHAVYFTTPSKINESLFPSFFSYELYVNEIDEKGELKKQDVPYHELSSGEIQMLQTLSIHAYHLENLFSNTESRIDDRPKYANANLVFDEVEICFHPEYQRQFVSRLISMLTSLRYNFYSINVFIITHSPFILSDIPKECVLYMKEGKSEEKEDYNTFGQNVGSLLYNGFFLDYYVGDFAKRKINEILNEFDQNKSIPKDVFEKKIQMFGDDLLRRQMLNYFESHKE